jgi:hypothetical protein
MKNEQPRCHWDRRTRGCRNITAYKLHSADNRKVMYDEMIREVNVLKDICWQKIYHLAELQLTKATYLDHD